MDDKLDLRLRQGEVITTRERFLLGIIGYLYDQDCWYLDQDPQAKAQLREHFGVKWLDEEDTP
jgi:hypothetical protein